VTAICVTDWANKKSRCASLATENEADADEEWLDLLELLKCDDEDDVRVHNM
jgi:hypothetical protein